MDHHGGALWADWDQHNEWKECGRKRRFGVFRSREKSKKTLEILNSNISLFFIKFVE